MKLKPPLGYSFLRLILGVGTALICSVLLFVTLVESWQDAAIARGIPIFLLIGAACVFLMLLIYQQTASVTLEENGVKVRVFFKVRYYPWTQIVQAGIIYGGWQGENKAGLYCCSPEVLPEDIKTEPFTCAIFSN